MDRFRHHWKKTPAPIRKPLVLIVGLLFIIAGFVMFFTPGPGWAAVFIGLAILATEFAMAERAKLAVVSRFKNAAKAAKDRFKR